MNRKTFKVYNKRPSWDWLIVLIIRIIPDTSNAYLSYTSIVIYLEEAYTLFSVSGN